MNPPPAAIGAPVDDIDTPALVVDLDALDHNMRRNAVKIDHTLWEYEPNKIRENAGESVRHGEAHESNLGIPQ